MDLFETLANAIRPAKKEVTIETNHIINKEIRREFDRKVEAVICKIWNIDHIEDYASHTVWDAVDPHQKDAALLIFGSDWACFQELLRGMKIMVEGRCPECGDKLLDAFWETRPQTYDHPSEGVDYERCDSCGWNNYNKVI
jgi:predicted RNA-binding Zn-ribbon protein involved in translation (DUF1610 family)